MFTAVTEQTGPLELATDTRNNWTRIGDGEYYQSDEKYGITLEIHRQESGKFRWWLYDADSSDPEMPVIASYDDSGYAEKDPTVADKDTIAEALAAVYSYLYSYLYY